MCLHIIGSCIFWFHVKLQFWFSAMKFMTYKNKELLYTYHTVYKATATNMMNADPAAITAYIQMLVGPSSEIRASI